MNAKKKALDKVKKGKFSREIARDKEINRRHAAGEVLSGDIDYGKNRRK